MRCVCSARRTEGTRESARDRPHHPPQSTHAHSLDVRPLPSTQVLVRLTRERGSGGWWCDRQTARYRYHQWRVCRVVSIEQLHQVARQAVSLGAVSLSVNQQRALSIPQSPALCCAVCCVVGLERVVPPNLGREATRRYCLPSLRKTAPAGTGSRARTSWRHGVRESDQVARRGRSHTGMRSITVSEMVVVHGLMACSRAPSFLGFELALYGER